MHQENLASHSSIKYPRRIFWRGLFRTLGRVALPVISRPILTGVENLPLKGPAILAGNHAAIMEVVLMAVYSRGQVEFLGTGDIPIDPKFAWLADLYGFIPIKRGSVDRRGIKTALSVLEQGGLLGIFPQGGIWDAAGKQSRLGVAMLSNLAKAPVVPIGFGGIKGALYKMGSLKRPKLIMNVGEPLPPIKSNSVTGDRKRGLEAGAEMVLEKIMALIPEEDRVQALMIKDETFDVEITINDNDGNIRENILILQPDLREALGMFFHYPVLLDALSRNLHLFVHPLQELEQFHEFSQMSKACLEILTYLEQNPGFFTFRFGIDFGINIQKALQEIADILVIEAFHGWKIRFVPVYQYIDLRDEKRHLLRGVQSLHDIRL